jgi:NAD(P)-dependent dehydrogenase (short-subunit alcohol dehydrogenase family)
MSAFHCNDSGMKSIRAIVVGGSSGVGRATVAQLSAAGAQVWAVARNAAGLKELPAGVEARALDATDGAAIARLYAEVDPDLVVATAGVRPRVAPIGEQSWESFSEPWNNDVKLAFELGQAALRKPLRPGSTVVIVSSGAGLNGSPLSGGYAGAKRMQMFLATYLQRASEARKLGIRFAAVVPKQLIAGTEIGGAAAAGYAKLAGITPEAFMDRFGTPLTPDGVASRILELARGDLGAGATVLAVTGDGVEPL